MENTDDLVRRGDECMDQMHFDEALSLFEQALSADPANPDLWNRAGVALRGLGRYEEASSYFERSLELDPRDRNSS